MSEHKDIDHVTGVETTGHEWDGIKELNNPLPRWWLWIFYASIVWAIAYMVFMPAIPGLPGAAGATKGIRNHSERANVEADLAALRASRADNFAKLANANLTKLADDPDLLQFTLKAGEAAFGDNCQACHGSGGQGARGYPSLQDDVWLWGGALDDIKHTLNVGIRSGHEDARFSQMPAFGRDGLLSREEIDALVEYVVSLSGETADAAKVAAAAENFEVLCSACHGANGKGDQTQGAPNLTDGEWLYGGERAAITETITNNRYGVMPFWSERLDAATIDALSVYVAYLDGDLNE